MSANPEIFLIASLLEEKAQHDEQQKEALLTIASALYSYMDMGIILERALRFKNAIVTRLNQLIEYVYISPIDSHDKDFIMNVLMNELLKILDKEK